MTFTESSTLECLVRDLLAGGVTHYTASGPGLARHNGKVRSLGGHNLPGATSLAQIQPLVD